MKLLGGILYAVGILIAGSSGLCSFGLLGIAISEWTVSGPGDWLTVLAQLATMICLFGGTPFVIGVGLITTGRSMIVDARPMPTQSSEQSLDIELVTNDESAPTPEADRTDPTPETPT